MHILMQYIAGNFNIEFMKWKWYKASRTKDVFFFSFKNYIKPCCPAPWYLFEVYTTKIGTGVPSIFSPHQNQQRVSIINKYLVKTTSNRHPICPSYFEFSVCMFAFQRSLKNWAHVKKCLLGRKWSLWDGNPWTYDDFALWRNLILLLYWKNSQQYN